MNTTYVTASELADYIYCECCWADKMENQQQETEEMIGGVLAHDRLHWQYQAIQFLRQVAIVVIAGSIAVLLLFLILLFMSGGIV